MAKPTVWSLDLFLGIVYVLHILWAALVFIPKIGDAVAEKCYQHYHCARHIRRSSFGYNIDLADGQWREFRHSLGLLMVTAAGTSFVVYVARNVLSKQLKFKHTEVVILISGLRIIIGVVILFVQHGYHALIVISIASAGYLLARLTYKQKSHFVVSWMFAVFVLLFKESYRIKHMKGFQFLIPLFDRRYGGMYGWQLPTNFLVLRIISYSLDLHWNYDTTTAVQAQKDDDENSDNTSNDSKGILLSDYSALHYFAYVLYAPLYMAGPGITYDNFVVCSKLKHESMMYTATISKPTTVVVNRTINSDPTTSNTSADAPTITATPTSTPMTPSTGARENIPLYALRFLLCLLLLEYLLHRFPFFAVAGSGLVTALSPLQTAVLSYVLLKMMWLKFLLLWRFFRLWAMCDGVYAPENMTRCMSNTYSLELFWRGWHSSFNAWLVRYLYRPLGGRGSQLYSVWLIFLFVALWHDIEVKLVAWGLLNALFYVVEVCVKRVVSYMEVHALLPAPLYELACAIGGAVYIIVLIGVNLVGYAVGVGGVSAMMGRLQSQEGLHMILGCFYFLVVAVLLMRLLKRHGLAK